MITNPLYPFRHQCAEALKMIGGETRLLAQL